MPVAPYLSIARLFIVPGGLKWAWTSIVPSVEAGLNLRGSGAVGALFGSRKFTANNSVLGGLSAQLEDSNRQTTTSLEGEAGIGYSFPSMGLTLGYRVERFSVKDISYVDVPASLASGTVIRSGNNAAIQYLEGGFLRLDVKL